MISADGIILKRKRSRETAFSKKKNFIVKKDKIISKEYKNTPRLLLNKNHA